MKPFCFWEIMGGNTSSNRSEMAFARILISAFSNDSGIKELHAVWSLSFFRRRAMDAWVRVDHRVEQWL